MSHIKIINPVFNEYAFVIFAWFSKQCWNAELPLDLKGITSYSHEVDFLFKT